MPPTRYLEIAEALADELSGLPTGSQVPSENDVAGRFRVGRSAPRAAIGAMDLPAGHPGVQLAVQMSAFDQPIGRSALWAAGTDRSTVTVGLKEHESLLRLIDANQIRLSYRSAQVTLASAGPELAEELGIGMQRPYWKVDAVLEDPDKAITAWARTEFRADRITLDLRIGAAAALPVR